MMDLKYLPIVQQLNHRRTYCQQCLKILEKNNCEIYIRCSLTETTFSSTAIDSEIGKAKLIETIRTEITAIEEELMNFGVSVIEDV